MKYFIWLLMLILASSCKKDRTAYLSDLQKEMLGSFKAGQVFYMLENQTDTLKFTVKTVSTSTASNGYFWENGGPHTWTESGKATFDCEKDNKIYDAEFFVVGGQEDRTIFRLHLNVFVSIRGYAFIKEDSTVINNKTYYNICRSDSVFWISTESGILKARSDDYELLRLQ